MALRRSAKAGSLDGNGFRMRNVVTTSVASASPSTSLGDDQQRAARLAICSSTGRRSRMLGNFLVVQQDVGILHQRELAILIVDESMGQGSRGRTACLRTMSSSSSRRAIFNGDHASLRLFHRRCDLLADHGIGNWRMLPTWAISLLCARLGKSFQFFNRAVTACRCRVSGPSVHAGGNKLHAPERWIVPARLRWGAVTGHVGVLEATSLTSAPMFSNLSFNSISLATDTPSLVIVGAP